MVVFMVENLGFKIKELEFGLIRVEGPWGI